MTVVKSPPLRYSGGKWNMAKWIISYINMYPHKIYVEPFGGGGSVLLRKPPSKVEVYNDLDDSVVNFFRVLRDPEKSSELIRLLNITPYSRIEFESCADYSSGEASDIERARRFYVYNVMAYSAARESRVFLRAREHNWASTTQRRTQNLHLVTSRLMKVCIENDDAFFMLDYYNRPETLFYLDPPYLPETMATKKHYRHMMTRDDHERLLKWCVGADAGIILSGYDNELYNDYLHGWGTDEKTSWGTNTNKNGKPNTEKIWYNFDAMNDRLL